MRRLFLLLALVLCCGVGWADPYSYATGTGVLGDPFEVWTDADLNGVRDHLESHFVMMADINLATNYGVASGWAPIGDTTNWFEGVFDGNNRTINNLFISRSADANVGIFGVASDGVELRNVVLTNVNVTGGGSAGTLVGYVYDGGVYGCRASYGTVVGSSAGQTSGGIAGWVADLENCHVASLTISARTAGGVAGAITGDAVNCSADMVRPDGIRFAGGFVGYPVSGATISRCSVTDSEVVASQDYAGGFVGLAGAGAFSQCWVDNVTVRTLEQGGGFLGGTSAPTGMSFTDCYVTRGSVNRTSGTKTLFGGFVGRLHNPAGASSSYVRCFTSTYVPLGGARGFGPAPDATGGTLTMTNNYWDTQTTTCSTTGGTATGLTTANAKKQASFSGWDFTNVWSIVENTDYPRLRWEGSNAVVYLANGGSSAPAGAFFHNGNTVTATGTGSLTRTGFAFVDWDTARDGTGTAYGAASDTFTMGTEPVYLYAQWTELPFSGIFLSFGANYKYNTYTASASAGTPRMAFRQDGTLYFVELDGSPSGVGPRVRYDGTTYGFKNKE